MACLHFNENVQRETEIGKDGKPYYRVSCPKFKLGEEVVCEVPVPPSYGKCYMYVVNNKIGKVLIRQWLPNIITILLFELLYGIYIYMKLPAKIPFAF